MAEGLKVRVVAETEAEQVLALQEQVHAAMPDKDLLVCLKPVALLGCLRDELSLGVYDGEKIVAFAVLIRNHPGEWNLGEEMGFRPEDCVTFDIQFVHPGYRGLGLQARLLRECEAAVRGCGARYGLATVAPGNAFSLNNFQRCGFMVYKRVSMYGGRDRYVMLKEL